MDREDSLRSRGRGALRWIVPLLLALPLAIVVLGLGACLPVPLGDPETSRVDPRLAGVWTHPEAGEPQEVLILIPYDSRTYLLLTEKITRDENGHRQIRSRGQYKAWLTTVKRHTFITLEPLYLREALDSKHDVPGYIVARIALSEDGNRVDAWGVDPEFPALAPLRSLPGHMKYKRPAEGEVAETISADEARALLQRVIAENVDNDALYTDGIAEAWPYVRVTDKTLLKFLFADVTGD